MLEIAVTADLIRVATSPAFVREQQTIANVRRLNWPGLAKPATQGLSVCEFPHWPYMIRLAKLMIPATKMMEVPGRIHPSLREGADSSGQQTGSWNLGGKPSNRAASVAGEISEMQVLSAAKSLSQVLAVKALLHQTLASKIWMGCLG